MKSKSYLEGKPFYHLPPTAVPIAGKDLRYALNAVIDPKKSLMMFLSELEEITGNSNCFLTSSGRSALKIILMSLQRISKRRKVILPAYTCPTVAQAVSSADLEPVFCDVDPKTLDLDRRALGTLIDDNTLCILPTHLYGLAQDISDLISLGAERGIIIVEDSAQAFGARIHGKLVGNFGDLGFFSLGRGKSLPTGHGGIILAKDQFVPLLSETYQELVPPATKRDLVSIPRYLALGAATTPFGWWFVNRSNMNPAHDGMNMEKLPPIHLDNLSPTQAGIGASILERIDQVNEARRRNAGRLIEIITPYKFISLPELPSGSEPVFLRLPIIPDTKAHSEKLFKYFSDAGIGVSRSYYKSAPQLFLEHDSPLDQEYPGATHLAECLLTLPTHPYMRDTDFKRIKSVLEFIDGLLENN